MNKVFNVHVTFQQKCFICSNNILDCLLPPWKRCWLCTFYLLFKALYSRHENFQEISWFQEILCSILLIFWMFWNIVVHFYAFSENFLKIHFHAWYSEHRQKTTPSLTLPIYSLHLHRWIYSLHQLKPYQKTSLECLLESCEEVWRLFSTLLAHIFIILVRYNSAPYWHFLELVQWMLLAVIIIVFLLLCGYP